MALLSGSSNMAAAAASTGLLSQMLWASATCTAGATGQTSHWGQVSGSRGPCVLIAEWIPKLQRGLGCCCSWHALVFETQ